MLKYGIKLCLVILCFYFSIIAAFNYEGYKIYDIITKSENEKKILLEFEKIEEFDFFSLKKIIGSVDRVMVPPKYQQQFEKKLNEFNINYKIINDNLAKSIEIERIENNFGRRSLLKKGQIGFTRYHRFDEINDYLERLAVEYKDRVTIKTVGRSYEKRWIKTLHITNGDGNPKKKFIFLDAGIHAREWIAPAAALYVIHQLVENYEENTELLKDYDWLILPSVNPDGYEYSHEYYRFWRKTVKPSGECNGTDANRNFDLHWGLTGASNNSCAETFMGVKPFSEPETQIVRDIMMSLSGQGKMYLTLHSYGCYLLYPWGWTSDLPATWLDLEEVSQAGAKAIKSATGTSYTVGSSTNVLYAAAGGSDDYAFGVTNFPISITMELPAGGTGFDPPPSSIYGFVTETWIGIKAMAIKVAEKY